MKKIAYFTMEIAPSKISSDLNKDFRTYSGGLGVLAGDYFKQSTDENLPIVFISILWKLGYTKQRCEPYAVVDIPNSNENWQEYVTDTNKTLKIQVEGNDLVLKVWKFNDGELYMLDADLEENGDYRYLTYNLYGGHERFQDQKERERILQEMILGIGGMELLKVLKKDVDFYHFNDGHAIFGAHRLIKERMEDGMEFNEAVQDVKKYIRFTTHTNVESGNEKHYFDIMNSLGANYGLNEDQITALGGNPYGMTVAALHTAGKVNAVARIHAETANILWKDVEGAPDIFPITNGVHLPTWQYNDISEAYAKGDNKELYNIHMKHKRELIELIKNTNDVTLDEDSLIIGFARRATDYKRWYLFAKMPELLERIINKFNVQFVFSGKCHKSDHVGRGYIRYIYELSQKYPKNVVYIEGYDVNLAKIIEGGSDIWLNTPNGLEASGTSGMKAGANGCINFSTPDGWWKEASIDGINGFDIFLHDDIENVDEWDQRDCISLMDILQYKILPTYLNDKSTWSQIMHESIKTVCSYYNTKRMIEEYFEHLYI